MYQLEFLCKKIGYQFQDLELLKLAITHRSVTSGENNERLEFLGDSILNFLTAKMLYEKFPKMKEGHLTRMRAHLVCEPSLAEIAKKIELNNFVILGQGERKSGGHKKDSILSDALEAVIGAVLKDSDIDTCENVVRELFKDSLEEVSVDRVKDSKTKLQELLQASQKKLPVYTVLEQNINDNQVEFVVNCKVELIEEKTIGRADSKRKAEQEAAKKMLENIDG